MTRINVGINPHELPSKLLLAEHREIKRIPNVIKSGRFVLAGQPKAFTLGTGHVKFFYTKLNFLKKRYQSLHQECLVRQFNVQDYSSAWDGIEDKFMGDYDPTISDRNLIIERILSKGFILRCGTN